MDTSNHEECYKLQENAIKDFNPDLVVGSSFGGYLACRLLNSGINDYYCYFKYNLSFIEINK